MEVKSWEEAHGFLGSDCWRYPILTAKCEAEARPGYKSKKAHEFQEVPEVFESKIKLLAGLIRKSSRMIAYTGAGISTAAGIGDYASKAADSAISTRPKLKSMLDAEPTLAHRVLVSLYRAGYLKHWVQQNHDGLPQKAGFPQHALNEIHGAWFDPSNPVVPMSGVLRSDLFQWMLDWEQKTDLVLAMGSSLCGMNADRVTTTCAKKSLKKKDGAIGTVIVSLQQTQLDDVSCLRIFAKVDDVMAALVRELELDVAAAGTPLSIPKSIEEDVFEIPYDKEGKLSEEKSILDLREGARVKILCGPYAGDTGVVTGKTEGKFYSIRFMHLNTHGKRKVPIKRAFGVWMIRDAVDGLGFYPDGSISLVNCGPDDPRDEYDESSYTVG